jgi:hypothetical protein
MLRRADHPTTDPAFEPAEFLYRRVDPEDVLEYEQGKYRVIDWQGIHNLSVVREKYGQPDFARWDSATDPGNSEGFIPQLHRDCYVFQIAKGDLPEELVSGGNVPYQFRVLHVPFDDLYAHSEIVALKEGTQILKENKFKANGVKDQYRGILTNKAKLVLKPGEVEPATPDNVGQAPVENGAADAPPPEGNNPA